VRLSQLGERWAVAALSRGLYSAASLTVLPGLDDAAAIRHRNSQLVMTSDIMFAPTHFPAGMKPGEIGRKVAIANISDLAAMGAEPLALLVAFGLPPSSELDYALRISSGISSACREYKCSFAGGDTKRADVLTLCGSALGFCEDEAELLRRSNALPGDIICLTGNVGDSYCGCQVLLGKAKGKLDKRLSEKLIRAFTRPHARIKEGRALAKLRCGIAAMDITDGLFCSAMELMRASGCGFEINSSLIPFSAEAKRFAHLQQHASPVRLLEWGEDYELLVSVRKKDFEKAGKAARAAGGKLVAIGEAVDEKRVYLDGEPVDVRGYDSFRQ